jgi:hypothetical protein
MKTSARTIRYYYNTLNSPSTILPVGTPLVAKLPNRQINPAATYLPFPHFASNTTYETTNATSSYNSLQTTYEHQLNLGLSLLANYTYSKCLSDQRTQAKTTRTIVLHGCLDSASARTTPSAM